MAHERDCGKMGHISNRLVPKWKPTKVRDGQLESQSQYLWILNMWHASLPTNLSNKSTSRLYDLSEITREGPNLCLHGSNTEKCAEVGRSQGSVRNLANWRSVYLFVI